MTSVQRPPKESATFRWRLLRVLAPVIVVIVGLLCGLVWLSAYSGYAGQATAVLEAEAQDVGFDLTEDGRLDAENYRWDEPHHTNAERRLDPIFIQVFDPKGELLRASENLGFLGDAYPVGWLGEEVTHRHTLPRLHVRGIDEEEFYIIGRPVEVDGAVLGFIQVGRFVPSERRLITRLAWVLLVLFFLSSGLIFGVVYWSTNRYVRPLEDITRFADTLSPGNLAKRVDLGQRGDRETAVLSRTVNGLLDRLEESMESMQDFTANAAHELRTPLTALKGHVEVALRRDRPAEEYRETLLFVQQRIDKQLSAVSALLLLARLDKAEGLQDPEPLSLALFCNEAAENLENLGEGQPAINVSAAQAHDISGQPDLVMRALANVLENALRYGEGAPVSVHLRSDDGFESVIVSDGGPGIPDAIQKSVFSRFARGPRSSKSHPGGAGLGLAVTSRIMELHRGAIEIESGPTGARVTLRFPKSRR